MSASLASSDGRASAGVCAHARREQSAKEAEAAQQHMLASSVERALEEHGPGYCTYRCGKSLLAGSPPPTAAPSCQRRSCRAWRCLHLLAAGAPLARNVFASILRAFQALRLPSSPCVALQACIGASRWERLHSLAAAGSIR